MLKLRPLLLFWYWFFPSFFFLFSISSRSTAQKPYKRNTCHHARECQRQRRSAPARLGFDHPGHRRAHQEAARVRKHVETKRQSQAVGIPKLQGMIDLEIRRRKRKIGYTKRDNPYQSEPLVFSSVSWFHEFNRSFGFPFFRGGERGFGKKGDRGER